MKEISNVNNINSIYSEIIKVIDRSKNRVATAINSEMIILYLSIGKIIKTKVLKDEKAEYGKSIIKELSKELTSNYGKGYSQANLFNMVHFAWQVHP